MKTVYILLLPLLLFASCYDDPCKNKTCANGGVCLDQGCWCPFPYEGELCDKPIRDRYVGVYKGDIVRDGKTVVSDTKVTIQATSGIPNVSDVVAFTVVLEAKPGVTYRCMLRSTHINGDVGEDSTQILYCDLDWNDILNLDVNLVDSTPQQLYHFTGGRQ